MHKVKAVSRLQHSFIVVLFVLSWDEFIAIFTKRIFTFLRLLHVITLYSFSFIICEKWVSCTLNHAKWLWLVTSEKINFLFLRWVNHLNVRKLLMFFLFLKILIWLKIMILWKIRNKNVNNCSNILEFLLLSDIIISQLFIMRIAPILIKS